MKIQNQLFFILKDLFWRNCEFEYFELNVPAVPIFFKIYSHLNVLFPFLQNGILFNSQIHGNGCRGNYEILGETDCGALFARGHL